uniref:Transcriptional activator HAP2 n=1 Tax=Kwoniella pini CBS 10737 TaxID=1296096 RepID=A0A1B9I7I9_9TREE|nr:nuclear transcription factor Y subunit alpha [Kwoniella pini CBS 10737]OCF51527.1 nuclear transcription factor Y subunit alpha [Kwoniella pini CBS 10737]
MSTTLPLFSLLHNGGGSYPPSPTFSDPSFSTGYDGAFDLKNGGLGNYNFPTPPQTSNTPSTSSYSSRHLSNYPQLIPPNFSHSSFPTTPDGDDPTSSFLDLDLSQPGPSTYHQISNGHHRYDDALSHHQSTSNGGSFILDGEDYLQHDDDDDDEEDDLVKIENGESDEAQPQDEGGDVDVDNEEPLYVNAKQYHRILKRRLARARLEELNRLVRSRKPYLHESRHRHACSRPRGKGGRFLTAEEIEQMKKEELEKVENGESVEILDGVAIPA